MTRQSHHGQPSPNGQHYTSAAAGNSRSLSGVLAEPGSITTVGPAQGYGEASQPSAAAERPQSDLVSPPTTTTGEFPAHGYLTAKSETVSPVTGRKSVFLEEDMEKK